ncbi:MAG: hypothetical protein IKE94_16735 [Aeriscardovia sp.]|nr:hypothetical protein [Aeriscardovia sp.]MBR2756056.1 hypothetical protein [Lachnospiraceae bacterium]
MNPNSLKNLIPNSQRTKEQLSEMGRKGGIASGKSKKENAVSITLELETYSEIGDEKYTIRAKTPEAAARAIAALEYELWKVAMKRDYGIEANERQQIK